MKSKFLAILFRMRYINRWSLMRNTQSENLKEHSFDVAVISHALMAIGKTYFGKSYDEKGVLLHALYHDVPEVLTGDLPTPVKYYNDSIKKSYKAIEKAAENKIISLLPNELTGEYAESIQPHDEEIKLICKAADRIAAVIKCKEEVKSGNLEFQKAHESQMRALKSMNMAEVDKFMELYTDGFSLSIDDIQK